MKKHFRLSELDAYENPIKELKRRAQFIIDKEIQTETPLDVAVFEFPSGVSCHEHVHDSSVEIYYMLYGQLVSTMEGKEYVLNANDLLYIPKGSIHRLENRSDQPASFLAVHVPPVEDSSQFRKEWIKL